VDIIGIEHIAINVLDGETSKDFYSRIFGFCQRETIPLEDFDITYFTLPNGARLEIFDYHGTNQAHQTEETRTGLRHLAFEVNDVAAHEEALKKEGVDITLPTSDLPDLNARVLLFLDPNGITTEFCEKLSDTSS
jgi:catechol 2,3-dioxygenase-like lactoylglutathione lyase family enzyme